MYIPEEYEWKDREAILDFVKHYNFGVLVTAGDGAPRATHLPFVVKEEGEKIILYVHLAKANPQCEDLLKQEVLVIFSGPHAYISPRLYEKEQNVPTWNYVAVHAYGKATVITDEAQGYIILEELMQQSEPEFVEQWSRLSESYKQSLFRGIVPVEIEVTQMEAKHKLSQNKTQTERLNIANTLSQSEDGAARETGGYMRENERLLNPE